MSRGLRRRTEDNEFAPIHFIDSRHPFQSSVERGLPKQLSRLRVDCAHLAIARAGEDQTSGGDHRSRFRKMRAGVLKTLSRQLWHFA